MAAISLVFLREGLETPGAVLVLPGMVVVTLGYVDVLFMGVVLTPGCEVEAPSCLLVFSGGVLLVGGVVGFPV